MHLIVYWELGGNEPLNGISVYDAGDYYHFVTYGLSELYEKESIKDYINVLNDEELMTLANKIYKIIDFAKADYPNHHNWFFNMQLPETLHSDRRNILFVKDKDEIIAVANLLKDKSEKKICSLYVKEEYQRGG